MAAFEEDARREALVLATRLRVPLGNGSLSDRAATVAEQLAAAAQYSDFLRGITKTAAATDRTPAVPIEESITDDFIICLEDARPMKMLARHLKHLGMTPDEYRARWGLPPDYPMTAPSYSKLRSNAAKAIGLGTDKVSSRKTPQQRKRR